MHETTGQRQTVPQTGTPLITVAFLGGAMLGALLVLLFCAFMPDGGVMPSRGTYAPEAGRRVAQAVPLSEPVSAEPVYAKAPDGQVAADGYGPEPGPNGASSFAAWPGLSRDAVRGVLLVTAGVLLVCLVGAAVLIRSGQQANARLEARIQRFEQLLAQRKAREGWLNNLEADLEGEWQDYPESVSAPGKRR